MAAALASGCVSTKYAERSLLLRSIWCINHALILLLLELMGLKKQLMEGSLTRPGREIGSPLITRVSGWSQ